MKKVSLTGITIMDMWQIENWFSHESPGRLPDSARQGRRLGFLPLAGI